jgi:hypothetical protein
METKIILMSTVAYCRAPESLLQELQEVLREHCGKDFICEFEIKNALDYGHGFITEKLIKWDNDSIDDHLDASAADPAK